MMYTLRLVKIVNKKRLLMDKFIKPLGFTRLEWQILTYLYDSKTELTQKDINQLLDNDQAFITRAIDKLEHKKLVKRKVNPTDKRQKLILLTAKGRPVAKKLLDYGIELNNKIMKDIKESELSKLYKITEQIEANITDLCQEQQIKSK